MRLFSSQPRVVDPYNTMGASPQGTAPVEENPDFHSCEYCFGRGYLTGTTGTQPGPNDLVMPIRPGDRQVRRGVWELNCPKCDGRGYFIGGKKSSGWFSW